MAEMSLLVLLVTGINPVHSVDISKGYAGNVMLNINHVSVYKFVDSKGKTTYSSETQGDFVTVERINIATPPSAEFVEQAQLRITKLQRLADQLSNSREKREELREEKEKQRLQRLALLNQSRPTVYERNIYLGYPYRIWKTHPDGGNHKPHKPHRPIHLPVARPNGAHLPLPVSSFSSALR